MARICHVTDSSNVRYITYYPQRSIVKVEYMNGSVYEYQNVLGHVFGNIVASQSVGKAVRNLLTSCHQGVKIN